MADFTVRDKITLDELSDSLRNLVTHSDGSLTIDKTLSTHISNSNIHITQDERDYWNNKVNSLNGELLGTPTAPTAKPGIYGTQIANTQFVKNELDAYQPARTQNADRLTNPVSITISGKILSDPASFDGSKDTVINVKSISASGITGTIDPGNLTGYYDIDITGNAASATNSLNLGSIDASKYALLDSPQFTGNSTAITQAQGDNSTKLATTEFVQNAIVTGSAKKLLNERSFSIGGWVTSTIETFDGTADVKLEITDIDQTKLDKINAATVNNHTVMCDVPIDAKFTDTDTIYVHPEPENKFTEGTFLQFQLDKYGHVINAINPSSLDIDITGTASKANILTNKTIFRTNGGISLGKINYILKGFVSLYSQIETNYPTPSDGWLVKVTSTGSYYRYDGTSWVLMYISNDDILSKLQWRGSVAKYDDIATTYPGTPTIGTTVVTKDTGFYYKYNSSTVNGSELKNWIDLSFDTKLADTVLDNITILDPVDSYAAIATTYLTPVENSVVYINNIGSKFIYTSGSWKLLCSTYCQNLSVINKYTGTESIDNVEGISAVITTPTTNQVVTLSDGTHYIYNGTDWNKLELTVYSGSISSLTFVNAINTKADINNAYPITPIENWMVQTTDTNVFYKFNGTSWEVFSPESTIDRSLSTYGGGDVIEFYVKNINPSYIDQSANYRFVTDTQISAWNAKAETTVVTDSTNGLMIASDKAKLDGIEANANKYTHPSTHPATMIVSDSNNRFVTDTQISTWNNKSEVIPVVTTNTNGVMSKDDKIKLDSIEANANKYTHPDTHAATMIVEDATHRFTTDTEKSTWSAKASTAAVTTSANGLMISTDKAKLDGIEANANKYTHPTNHAPSIITQDSSNRFVTDAQISLWSTDATGTTDGLMSSTDKTKLDSIEAGANKYTHPTTHAPSIIAQDTNNRFVTDSQIASWDSKAGGSTLASTTANGLMSKDDKTKLDGIATGANNYVHPTTHPATMITTDSTHEFVTDAQITTWNSKASTSLATTTVSGLMAYGDKVKLDGIATGANNYTHPSTHPASMITGLATVATSGSYNDLLNAPTSLPANGGNAATVNGFTVGVSVPSTAVFTDTVYTHPATHPATMIVTDSTHRFVTDTQINSWTAKAEKTIATTTADGLMSSVYVTKLLGIDDGANNYVHPESGITAGTYRSVTVDSKGHVTAGTTHVDIDGHATIEWDSTTNSIVYNFA